VAAFAVAADLATFLGTDVDAARADEVLADATAAIKGYTRQTIEAVPNDDVVLRGTWSQELWLPERPVTAVSSVVIRNGAIFASEFPLVADKDYRWDRRGLLRRVAYVTGRLLAPASGYWGGEMAYVEVTYSHGFAQIPDDIRAVCLSVASRVYVNPQAILRESVGSYTVQYGRTAAAQLDDEEKAQLNRYRRRFSMEASPR
jgi:hypothetical protein